MVLDPTPGAESRRDNRLGRRRPAKTGCVAEVRLGALGLGPDIGAGIIDVSEDGACVRVKAALQAGAQVEVRLTGPGCRKPVSVFATICWCRPDGKGFLAGLRLRRRLTHTELADLSRPA
jgi:PilZ domain